MLFPEWLYQAPPERPGQSEWLCNELQVVDHQLIFKFADVFIGECVLSASSFELSSNKMSGLILSNDFYQEIIFLKESGTCLT